MPPADDFNPLFDHEIFTGLKIKNGNKTTPAGR
jgi:hypothetical protein